MGKLTKNQSGFGLIGVLLAIVVLGLVGFTGWYVWNANKTASDNLKSTNANVKFSHNKKDSKSTTFTDTEGVYSFQLPEDWSAEYMANNKGMLTLMPKDFKAPGNENNWVISVSVLSLPGSYSDGTTYADFAEYKKLNLSQSVDKNPGNQELRINGVDAWKFTETVPKTGSEQIGYDGGYQDISYNFHKDKNRMVRVWMRVKQGESTNYHGDKITSAYDYSKYVPNFEKIAKSFKVN